MTSRTDHRSRLHSAADRLRERLKKDWGFQEKIEIIEGFILTAEEIMSILSDQLDAATNVITQLEANQVDAAAQASLVKLNIAVAATTASLTPPPAPVAPPAT